MQNSVLETDENIIFSGNIFVFHAFDVGDDINLEAIRTSNAVISQPLTLPKYFKNYHMPLAIDLPHPHSSGRFLSCKIHNFGAISFAYKIPFKDTLKNIRERLDELDDIYQEQSVNDVSAVFKKIKSYIAKPKFFQTRSSYLVIQVDPQPNRLDIARLKNQYGSVIVSMLRFETETLSEYHKEEILEDAIGYFRGDLIVIDTEATFMYDDEYEELLHLFEFCNIQQLELRYFDRLLDQQLNIIYEGKPHKLPFTAYLPFVASAGGSMGDLGKLRVDISVIVERLEDSIKLVGEAYFSELYQALVDKLDLKNWQESIARKLTIIQDVRTVYQNQIDTIHEDLLSVLIIILIFIELVIGVLNYMKAAH
jgi:hypothetical protein